MRKNAILKLLKDHMKKASFFRCYDNRRAINLTTVKRWEDTEGRKIIKEKDSL